MNTQKGSIYIWAILIIFILGGVGVWFYTNSQSKLAEELANDRVMPSELPLSSPSPSPDYTMVQEQYNLNSQQVEILSKVVNDDKL
jgi:amino acid transporter